MRLQLLLAVVVVVALPCVLWAQEVATMPAGPMQASPYADEEIGLAEAAPAVSVNWEATPACGPAGYGRPQAAFGGILGCVFTAIVLIGLLASYVVFAVLIGQLAARKGRSAAAWAMVALVPFANVAVWHLVGLPDAGLAARLAELERRLGPPAAP